MRTPLSTFDSDRVAALEALLAGASRTKVNGYDTLQLSGVNLQLVNGAGSTDKTNGLGNLVVGYGTPAGWAYPAAVETLVVVLRDADRAR